MISKIQLKRLDGSVLFEYEDEDNSVKKTLETYIKKEREKGNEIIDLTNADLEGAYLVGIDLSFTNLFSANLTYADLKGADLSNADLSYTDLSNANLNGANLKFADLTYADLKDAKLSYAKLSNAILNSAENIKYAYCCFRGHGEIGRQLLAVEIDNEIILFCGCFKGNEAELRKYIEEDEEKYKASRLMALEMVLKFIEVEKLSI